VRLRARSAVAYNNNLESASQMSYPKHPFFFDCIPLHRVSCEPAVRPEPSLHRPGPLKIYDYPNPSGDYGAPTFAEDVLEANATEYRL
jgi:hypothetical protein